MDPGIQEHDFECFLITLEAFRKSAKYFLVYSKVKSQKTIWYHCQFIRFTSPLGTHVLQSSKSLIHAISNKTHHREYCYLPTERAKRRQMPRPQPAGSLKKHGVYFRTWRIAVTGRSSRINLLTGSNVHTAPPTRQGQRDEQRVKRAKVLDHFPARNHRSWCLIRLHDCKIRTSQTLTYLLDGRILHRHWARSEIVHEKVLRLISFSEVIFKRKSNRGSKRVAFAFMFDEILYSCPKFLGSVQQWIIQASRIFTIFSWMENVQNREIVKGNGETHLNGGQKIS